MIRALLNPKTTSISVISLLLLASAGCSVSPGKVWVYIDNAGHQPLSVSVDGKQAATVQPGKFAELSYPPGDYQFRITSGDEVLCDLPRKLEKSDRFGVSRRYLFNPDKNNRYQTYTAKYGASRLDGVMQAGLLSYQKDPVIKRQYIYKQLLKEVKLLPSDAWNDVSGIDYVLSAPPDKVYSRGTARRTVLWRISPRFYDQLKGMEKIDKPTDEDIDSLDDLLGEILSDAP
jgi:hypothetical protein